MKKTAILLALCMTVLSGCGRVDTVDVDSDIKPFEIEKTTDENGEESENSDPTATGVTTVSGEDQTAVTTARTGAVNLVKRTGVAATSKRKPSGNGTVRVPSRPTTPRPSGSTAAPSTTTTTAVTTIPDEKNPAVVVRDNMTCRVTPNGITVTYMGEPVQNISISTKYMLDAYANGIADSSSLVNINDFDFDGHFDLFIPQSQSDDKLNTYGTFLHYNPKTNLFEKWDEISQLETFASTADDEETISATIKKNDAEFETKTYEWQIVDEETGETELTLIRMKKQYRLDNSPANLYNIYIDYYEYSNGVETIVKREKHIYDENNNFTGVEEIPVERN